jgi:hypothetical protein
MSGSQCDFLGGPLDPLFAGQLETGPGGSPASPPRVWDDDSDDNILEWAFVFGLLWLRAPP